MPVAGLNYPLAVNDLPSQSFVYDNNLLYYYYNKFIFWCFLVLLNRGVRALC